MQMKMAVENFTFSYGIYYLGVALGDANFPAASSLKLQVPIPDSLVAAAPDSVGAYWLDPEKISWQKQGYAHKVTNYYETPIAKQAFGILRRQWMV